MSTSPPSVPPLAFDDLGRGEPVALCLPGWCQTRSVIAPLAERLARSRRVVDVDLPGHGDTPAPAGDFSTEDVVTQVLALLDRLGVERCVPITVANAGWFGLELARRAPTRIAKLVQLGWVPTPMPPMLRAGLQMLTEPADWEEARDGFLGMWLSAAPPHVRDYVAADMRSFGFDMWARAGREILASNAAEGSPIGLMDRLSPRPDVLSLFGYVALPPVLQALESTAAARRWFHFLKLEPLATFPSYEAPDAAAAAIEAFLAPAATPA